METNSSRGTKKMKFEKWPEHYMSIPYWMIDVYNLAVDEIDRLTTEKKQIIENDGKECQHCQNLPENAARKERQELRKENRRLADIICSQCEYVNDSKCDSDECRIIHTTKDAAPPAISERMVTLKEFEKLLKNATKHSINLNKNMQIFCDWLEQNGYEIIKREKPAPISPTSPAGAHKSGGSQLSDKTAGDGKADENVGDPARCPTCSARGHLQPTTLDGRGNPRPRMYKCRNDHEWTISD
jgi:hypothetical protein